MLRLVSQSGQLIRTTATDISFVRRNHLLSVENIPKDFSFPFVVPIKGNEQIFNHLHDFAVQDRNVSFPAYLESDGVSVFKGLINLDRADKDYYRATLVSDLATDVDVELPLPSIFVGDTISYSDAADGSPMGMNDQRWPDVKYCWPSWQNDDEYFLGEYLYDRVNPYVGGSAILTSGSGTVPLNMALYLPEVLERVANKLGYTAEGTLFRHEELCSAFIWNNNVVRWNLGAITVGVDRLVPDITIFEFLKNIRAIGVTTDIDTERRVMRFDVMSTILDQRDKTEIDESLDRTYEIEFADYNGLCQDIQFTDSHGQSVSGDLVNIEIANTINWSHEMDPVGFAPPQVRLINGFNMYFYAGDVIFCTGDNSYYVWDEDEGQYLYKYNASKYCIGNGDLSLPEIKTITMYENDERQLLPRVNHEVSDISQYKPFDFKVLFNRGIVKNVSGDNYAFTTCDNYKMNITPPEYLEKFGDLSLLPNREDSVTQKIVAPFYKKITEAKQVKGILHGDWMTKHRFKYTNHLRLESTNFIWRQLQFSISENGFGPTQVEMLKIT